MLFSSALLRQNLVAANQARVLWVAFSGGMDSTVLLHACQQLARETLGMPELRAIHVNHGLSPNAARWQQHCEDRCQALGIPLHSVALQVLPLPGESPEQAARRQRYQVFEAFLEQDDFLLLAHHQDDQAETILYRLLRGSGPKGLSGMPVQRRLGKGELLRPLLTFSRHNLEIWAKAQCLCWIEDESNSSDAPDRNFLRNQILPLIAQRWPGYRETWSRSASLCRESEALVDDYIQQLFAMAATPDPAMLKLDVLASLSPPVCRRVLRHWLELMHGKLGLPRPDSRHLQRMVEDVIHAQASANPCLEWGDYQSRAALRRYRQHLYLMPVTTAGEPMPGRWHLDAPHELGHGLGHLVMEPVDRNGIDLRGIDTLEVVYRKGGERVRPAGRQSRPLQKLFQEHGIPPWRRHQVPLLYAGETLVAVGDLFVCEGWFREQGPGLVRVRWDRGLQ